MTYQEKLERAKEVKEKYREVFLSIPGLKSITVSSDGKKVYLDIAIASDINPLMRDVVVRKLRGFRVRFYDPSAIGGVLKPLGK